MILNNDDCALRYFYGTDWETVVISIIATCEGEQCTAKGNRVAAKGTVPVHHVGIS